MASQARPNNFRRGFQWHGGLLKRQTAQTGQHVCVCSKMAGGSVYSFRKLSPALTGKGTPFIDHVEIRGEIVFGLFLGEGSRQTSRNKIFIVLPLDLPLSHNNSSDGHYHALVYAVVSGF